MYPKLKVSIFLSFCPQFFLFSLPPDSIPAISQGNYKTGQVCVYEMQIHKIWGAFEAVFFPEWVIAWLPSFSAMGTVNFHFWTHIRLIM